MLNIQRLDLRHISWCLDILTSNFESPWKELDTIFENPANRVYGAFIEGEGVGFVAISTIQDESEILMCAVDPQYHKKGIATDLVKHILQDLKTLGVVAAFLEVDTYNLAAQGLYKKFGFETVGQRKQYYRQSNGSYHDAIVMRLSIR
jgi:[ribosomal protein S18]-alanine N-acetyltransferase